MKKILLILGLVVIIVILGVIALPTYLDYVKSSYASEAVDVIKNIDDASKTFFDKYKKWPDEVDMLEQADIGFNVSRSIKHNWTFRMSFDGEGFLVGDGGFISAVSSEDMKGGPGNKIVYYTHIGEFSGYGTKIPPMETKSLFSIICPCMTDNNYYNDNEKNCDRKINKYLGHNWKDINYSKSPSESKKFDRLAEYCNSSVSSSFTPKSKKSITPSQANRLAEDYIDDNGVLHGTMGLDFYQNLSDPDNGIFTFYGSVCYGSSKDNCQYTNVYISTKDNGDSWSVSF